jgi:hypothetical protein
MEEHRLRVLKRIFGPRMNEIIGGWRKVCSEELCNLYSQPKNIRMIKSMEDRICRACSMRDREEFVEDFGRRMDRKETTRKKQM